MLLVIALSNACPRPCFSLCVPCELVPHRFCLFVVSPPLIIAELHPSSSSSSWVLLAWDRNFPLPIFGVSRRNFFTIWALWPDSQWRPGLRWARFDFSSRCWKGRCDEKLSSDRDVASGALSNIVCWPLGFTLSFFPVPFSLL